MRPILIFAITLMLAACTAKQTDDNRNHVNTAESMIQSKEIKPTVQPTHEGVHVERKDAVETDEVLLDVPIIPQNPELKYGCEVTSLTMLLQYAGIKTDKMRMAVEMPKDADPMKKTKSGDITHWGNPEDGFVGDITGKNKGYAIYAKPLEQLMEVYLPEKTVNLTGKPFEDLLKQLKDGKPVVIWTTGNYKLPDRWESWQHQGEEIKAPLDLHAVVLVGFDSNSLYVNDPLTGKKAHKVNKQSFIDSWVALGKQALSYK